MWFSVRIMSYSAGRRQAGEYEQFLNDQYYLPYKKASDLYLKTYDSAARFYAQAAQPGRFAQIAADAATQIVNLIDIGWQKYQAAAGTYNNLSAGAVSTAEQGIYTKLCKGHEALCERFGGKAYNGTSIDNAVSQMQAAAADKFYEKTGYPISGPKRILSITRRRRMRSTHVEQKLQEQIAGYALPLGWLYDPATFRNDLLRMLQDEGQSKALEIASQAQQAWQDRVQSPLQYRHRAGLEPGGFLQRLGDPLPVLLKDMVMSESDFKKKYIVPINRNIADKTLENIKNEEPSYANRQELAEQGKDYIRVLYIPAIALCLSIMIVVITIGRYTTALATDVTKSARLFRGLTRRQAVLLGGVSGVGIGAALQMAELLYINQGVSKTLSGARQIARHRPPSSTGSSMCSRSFTGRARLCRISRI